MKNQLRLPQLTLTLSLSLLLLALLALTPLPRAAAAPAPPPAALPGGQLQPPAVITAVKTARPLTGVQPGGLITYSIVFTTDSQKSSVIVTDTLAAGLIFQSAFPTGSAPLSGTGSLYPPAQSGQTLVWTMTNVQPNSPVHLTFTVQVATDTKSCTINNRALIRADGELKTVNAPALPVDGVKCYIYLPVVLKNYPPPLVGEYQFKDSGFENGSGWTEFSSNGYPLRTKKSDLYGSIAPRNGDYLAWLGGMPGEHSILSQVITIPPGYETLHLSFYYWIDSVDGDCGADTATVSIGNNTQPKIVLCKGTITNKWKLEQIQFNAAAYAGQQIEFKFDVQLDGSNTSNFFLDDVTLTR